MHGLFLLVTRVVYEFAAMHTLHLQPLENYEPRNNI